MTKKKTMTETKRNHREEPLKNALILILAAVVVLLAVITVQVYRQSRPTDLGRITINQTTFHAEIAADDETRRFGLMLRKSLPEKTGMLFIFDKPDIYPFWMRNTLISLDIIFIDENRKIINICTMPPETDEQCRSDRPALYVLELEAGSANRYHLEPGQPVEITLPARQPQKP
jgi:hypothetical protein